jgi:ribosomal protein S24E
MSITQLNITNDVANELFGRREVNILLRDSYGKLSRTEAKKTIAANLKVDENSIFIIDISGHSGNDDANVFFHIYNSVSDANRYLPKYILKRNSVVTQESELSPERPKESVGSDF